MQKYELKMTPAMPLWPSTGIGTSSFFLQASKRFFLLLSEMSAVWYPLLTEAIQPIVSECLRGWVVIPCVRKSSSTGMSTGKSIERCNRREYQDWAGHTGATNTVCDTRLL